MLKHLHIRNFAIIDKLELDFNAGMTTLTGETGAGKSILLGALNLVLGDRADNDSIKQGCPFAEVVAEFDITILHNVAKWLLSRELNTDEECILRRRISKDGRSRAYINSTQVNLQTIRELAEMLIDIHGQHEHQSIMKKSVQRQLLDDSGEHRKTVINVAQLFEQLKQVEDELQRLQTSSKQQNDRLDLLRFQIQELDTLALEAGEYPLLNKQHKCMANTENLHTTVTQAIYLLSENESANIQSSLSHVISILNAIEDIDKNITPISEMLNAALLNIDESVLILNSYRDNIDTDSSQLAAIEQRIQNIIDLARKHRVEPQQLHKLHKQLQQELDAIDHADERLDELISEQKELEAKYLQACSTLTRCRKKTAKELNKSISQSMQTLGMPSGKFEIILSDSKTTRSAHGLDQIEFTVSANSGQSCKPLARIASGGELARISLAIQMIIAKNSKIPSLIFDEVDSGIGGGIAEIVGQHLRTLASTNQENTNTDCINSGDANAGDIKKSINSEQSSQVICITHLPQVASQAHHHLRVEKQTRNKQTTSRVVTLDKKQRRQEIARMLSGIDVTDQSLKHADEMINRAQTA